MQVLTAFILFLLFIPGAGAASASPGEAIYRMGVLPSGETLRGMRESDNNLEGMAAACVSCHRRSGLGTQEGRYIIPPIIGKYLFRPGLRNIEDMSLPHVEGYRPNRSAYTDETLARAIREGIDADGRELNYLMPRFKLDDAGMQALIAYLRELTSQPVPGVTEETLQFATIVTPDADPVKRKAMLTVLEQFFTDKNSFIRGGHKPMHSTREIMYRVTRQWKLHVWELTGATRNLGTAIARTSWPPNRCSRSSPDWAARPGRRCTGFANRRIVPCLLPNVDLPVVAENDFYPVYFSKGILLEAQLIARQILEMRTKPRKVTQVFRHGDIGAAAAGMVRSALLSSGMQVQDIALPEFGPPQALSSVQKNNAANSVVVLWLRPTDLAELPDTPPDASPVFISGLMGGLENSPVPAGWREATRMSYPFDLPDQRRIRMNFPSIWFKVHNIPVVDERVQSDTYLACGILAETLGEMLDSFVRDYLVERVEIMLSHRVITGYYPRLGLAQGQRFASKGGYMVRLAGADGKKLVVDSGWIVP